MRENLEKQKYKLLLKIFCIIALLSFLIYFFNRLKSNYMNDPVISQIELWAVNWEPENWAFCDGRLLQIRGNEALYSLIGNQFGGDSRTTFALPDLKGKSPIPGMAYIMCIKNGMYPTRQ